MLRYLTQKLRTQSLNESEAFQSKADDDHDSGTESDDESADIEELQKYMENIIQLDGQSTQPGGSRRDGTKEVTLTDCKSDEHIERQRLSRNSKTDESPLPEAALDSALPSDSDHNFDHHSSEEELEVINSASVHQQRNCQYPEKRKWSQANRLSLGENSCSSDDELRDLMCISAPVEFRSSPPANVHKPSHSQSPPPKVFHSSAANIPPIELCSVSPRKRHRRTPTATSGANVQRPCLDFEKMQQKLVKRHIHNLGRPKVTRMKEVNVSW
ncbi:uncharacterized protein [Centruroides vittatus]|uniref:uncharacterized protein isoform X3 n=1 Tax=Centruroides vittatus TaxID=120091 RepID=UPI00350F1390